ncbi:MAG: hypothetical protein A2513_00110 [Sulfurimonas sp. RIFOXYD12_FULL_33_39]|uniref:DUF4395 domain-containing protein n=1 Tax=unclassified Sulfurimonas TaxID=2623549 RepID=UPI0008B9A66C|nr:MULTISPECIES: DUF4395 domain-containing protein [unclassified Sulfurimonas]OHE10737.1 MAG: hypothetical protein A2513_00110 [Sulfurimonas sp. RIFOXYD12_FULL_33_39]OHE13493.1 MAG: hypothetical protein A2530_08070 [Sulfurimonas sp. RIFOXYD2_FULL_34_21]
MKSCPVVFKKVDENVLRILAGFISALGIIFIASSQIFVLFLLLYDFFVRVFNCHKISPLFYISILATKVLKLNKREVDAGPKGFASKLGLILVFCALSASVLGFSLTAATLIAILVICALLEALFSFCIGCQIYFIIKKFM